MRARYLIPEVLVLSAYYRFKVLYVPFRKWNRKIGKERTESCAAVGSDRFCRTVSAAVNKVCDKTPWKSTCLVKALTAKKILNRRKYPCTLYMGVSKDPEGNMIAHAWLRCGEYYVTGGRGAGYVVTDFYGDENVLL